MALSLNGFVAQLHKLQSSIGSEDCNLLAMWVMMSFAPLMVWDVLAILAVQTEVCVLPLTMISCAAQSQRRKIAHQAHLHHRLCPRLHRPLPHLRLLRPHLPLRHLPLQRPRRLQHQHHRLLRLRLLLLLRAARLAILCFVRLVLVSVKAINVALMVPFALPLRTRSPAARNPRLKIALEAVMTVCLCEHFSVVG